MSGAGVEAGFTGVTRARLGVLVLFLLAVSVSPAQAGWRVGAFGVFPLTALLAARLPVAGVLWRAAAILAFTVPFAVGVWIAGEPDRALLLLLKSYVSALACLVTVGVTPWTRLVQAFRKLGMPPILTQVMELLYRYLFLLAGQAAGARTAALCRGFAGVPRFQQFRVAAGVVAVLFGRSLERAGRVERGMAARGFRGEFLYAGAVLWVWQDTVLVCFSMTGVIAAWWVLR